MKKYKYRYLAHDAINCEYERFETIEDARKWLEEGFLVDGEYSPELTDCAIFELKEVVKYDVIASKSDYKYEYEDDAPEGEESEAWPYDTAYEEIWQHKFVDIKTLDL